MSVVRYKALNSPTTVCSLGKAIHTIMWHKLAENPLVLILLVSIKLACEVTVEYFMNN